MPASCEPRGCPNGTIRSGVDLTGSSWTRLIQQQYAIHGTNCPESTGNFVSYGCIRMFNEVILALMIRALATSG